MLRLFLCGCALLLAVLGARGDDFILSYWCGPPSDVDLEKAYADVAEAGFTYTMFPCAGSRDNKAILDICAKNKLKCFVYDSRILQAGPGSPQFETNLNSIIADYSKHPAMGGYYIIDEPAPDAFPHLAAVNQYLVAKDPKHLPYINLYPNYVPEWAVGPYESYVEKFVAQVKPKLLCFDHYGLLTDGTLRPIYFENLEIIRKHGLSNNIPYGFIFQVTAHGSYREVSEGEIRWQANTALVYGYKALLYFTYWSPTADALFKDKSGIIDPSGKRSPHFDHVKRLNAEIKAWAPTLMKLQSTGVYHTGTLPKATRPIPSESKIQASGGEFVVGTFKHEDGSAWCMIANRDMAKEATATLEFKDAKRLRELSRKNGKLSSIKHKKGKVVVQLSPGEAKLFKF